MKALFLRSAAILLTLSVAGCSTVERVTGRRTGVDVTRSHLGQPIARGSIAIESFDQAGDNVAEFQSYRTAVARQLTRLGWTLAGPGGQSEQVALIDVQQGSPAAIRGRIGTAGGVGLGGTSPELVATLLEVRIKRRSDGTIFWDGRATTEARANSAEAQRTAAVEKLAEALFRDFPGESGRTIRVR
jgi:hypothetical protein